MRIVLFTNLLPVYAALQQLRAAGWLKAVVCTNKGYAQNPAFKELCENDGITFAVTGKENLLTDVEALFDNVQPDIAFMFGFSYHIPPAIYQTPPMGFYNVHFSMLPAYRGPDPVFHQLKNGELMSGVSIHKVDKQFDAGDVIMQQPLPLMPGETWGLCFGRHIPLAANMILQMADKLSQGQQLPATVQNELQASYHPKTTPVDLTIKWDLQTAAQIDNLVNACNPSAGGAITFFRQQPLRLLEVSQVNGQSQHDVQPGTIIHAGADGVFVQCIERQLLRINILSLSEGVITGAKFAALGIKAGDRFEASIFPYQLATN